MNRRFYIVSYDLKAPGRDYSSLYSAIKTGREWLHPLESMWIVWTTESASELYNSIHPMMDPNDLLFISEINPRNRQGWLAKTCWEWMNQRIN